MDEKRSKVDRVLGIYSRLLDGNIVNKVEMSGLYGVDERSIQRDIEDIRSFLEKDIKDRGYAKDVVYDRQRHGYRLTQISRNNLSNDEILAISKILLDSRAFTKGEMKSMLNRFVKCCTPDNEKKVVEELIANEMFHYIEPHHKKIFINKMWDIGEAIRACKYIEIDYVRTKDKAIVHRRLKPASIMFSEYYFYLAAFIDDDEINKNFDVMNDSYPTIYRIDRIEKLTVINEHFHVPYATRFSEGEFRKRVQFMYGGKLQRIKFKYKGDSIEAVLDKLPTAEIIATEADGYVVSAEVFGKGIDMWLKSQGDLVEVLS